jgi:hypothetical protein
MQHVDGLVSMYCCLLYLSKKKKYCCLLGKEGEKNPESYFSCGHAVQKKLKKSKAKESQVREREREECILVVLLLETSNKAVGLFTITYLDAKLCRFLLILNLNQQWALFFSFSQFF